MRQNRLAVRHSKFVEAALKGGSSNANTVYSKQKLLEVMAGATTFNPSAQLPFPARQ